MENVTYLNRITSLYRDKPKFIAWLSAALDKIHGATAMSEILDIAFDIDHAEGKQLDILGDIIGQARRATFNPSDGSGSVLSDDHYRVLLKAKVVQNIWNGEIEILQPTWNILFPNSQIIIRDNQDMTMDVNILGGVPLVIRELMNAGYIVPKPEAVGMNLSVHDNAPLFGYDIDNEYISGYDHGNW